MLSVVTDPKAAHTAAGTTMGTAWAAVFEIIPVVVGVTATVIGIIISIWVGRMQAKQYKLNMQLIRARIRKLEATNSDQD